MILECPQCKTKVKIPDESIGKKARCSRCWTVFVAEEDSDVDVEVLEPEVEEPEVVVPITEEPEIESGAFADPQAALPPIRGWDVVPDARNADPRIALPPPTWQKAAAEMRFAAKVMLFAFLLSIVALGIQASKARWPIAGDSPEFAFVSLIQFRLHGFLILGSLFAATALFQVGPRFLIILGIESSFILSADLAFQALGNFIRLNNERNLNLVGHDIFTIKEKLLIDALVFATGSLASLLAAILAIFAINRINAWRWYHQVVDLDKLLTPQMANRRSARERAASAVRRAATSKRVAVVISIGATVILAIQIPWRVGMHPDIESGLLIGLLLDGMTIILVTVAGGTHLWSRPSYWTNAGILGNLFLFVSFLIRILPIFVYLYHLSNHARDQFVAIYWKDILTMLLNSLAFGIAAAANLVAARLAINWINITHCDRQERQA